VPLALVAAAGAACAACHSGSAAAVAPAPGVSSVALQPAVDFAFDSLDERPVSSQATRGEPSVVVFVTTGSLAAQAQVDFLVGMARRDGDRVHYAVVAVEPPENRELVEIYRRSLGISFPVAMADAKTLAGTGPFGDISVVPVTVVLDRAGRVALRVDGRVVKSEELRAAMHGL
jgi:hypothetical protein